MGFLRHGGKRMFPVVMEVRKTFCPMYVQRPGDNFTIYRGQGIFGPRYRDQEIFPEVWRPGNILPNV